MITRSANGEIRHIYYIDLDTGELTEDHAVAVALFNTGDVVAVMEEKDGREVLRTTWDH